MFNILNNWKLYLLSFALISVLSLNILQRFKIEILEGKLQVCQANAAAQQIAINLANEQRTELERKLRLREQEAAKAQAESQKRMDEILMENANSDDWMLNKALQFQWDNNIP